MIDHATSLVQPNHIDTTAIATGVTRHNPNTKDAIYGGTARPQTLAPILENIPAAMRAVKQWVFWDLVPKKSQAGKTTWTKVPLRVHSVSKNEDKKAKSDDPATWAYFRNLQSVYRSKTKWLEPRFAEMPKPGFVFAANGGKLGIDLDKVRNPITGELSPLAARLVAELPGYWEVSPSGTGIKAFFLGALPDGWKGRKVAVGESEIELYDRGRYFAVTGHRLDGATTDLTSIAERLPAFLAEFFPTKPERDLSVRTTTSTTRPTTKLATFVNRRVRIARARGWLNGTPGAVSGAGGHTHTIRVCGVVVRGFDLTYDEAFGLLCNWNRKCSPPWDDEAEGGADSLRRKLRDANNEPGERGFMLTEDTPLPVDAETQAADLATLNAAMAELRSVTYIIPDETPACIECKGVTVPVCGDGDLRARCRCKPLVRIANACVDVACGSCPSCSLKKQVREQPGHAFAERKPSSTALLGKLVGNAPVVSACPRRTKQLWHGRTAKTINIDALVFVACGCWNCDPCRTRERWKQKNDNVPFALSNGTHYWRGTINECNAMCKRLSRAAVSYAFYWITLGDGERAGVLAVAHDQLDSVPADIPNLQPATGEACARKLAHYIDLIPNNLPLGTHRYQSRGSLEWAPEAEDELQPENGTGSGELVAVTESEHPFDVDKEVPVIDSDDEFATFLWSIDAEQEARGIPDEERVNPRRGRLDNGHEGGAIECSIIWRRPDDPEFIEKIRAKLFDLPPIVERLSFHAEPRAKRWAPSNEPIPA